MSASLALFIALFISVATTGVATSAFANGSFGAFSGQVGAQSGIESVVLDPDYVFVPPGFDDNDQAEVVIYGYLPNTCYRVGPARAEFDASRGRVVIRNEAYYSDSSWCLQMTLPYTQSLPIGVLTSGQYPVTLNSQTGSPKDVGTLAIAKSSRPSAGPDDAIYGLVEDVRVDASRTGSSQRRMTLRGLLSSSCLALKEVKVLTRVPGIVEVLPIAEFKAGVQCRQELVPFETTVDLQTSSTGPTLFHVRSLNGQALNRVIELR